MTRWATLYQLWEDAIKFYSRDEIKCREGVLGGVGLVHCLAYLGPFRNKVILNLN